MEVDHFPDFPNVTFLSLFVENHPSPPSSSSMLLWLSQKVRKIKPNIKYKEKLEEQQNTVKNQFFQTYIYKIEDKASFQHDMAYGGFKDLTRRTASDKIKAGKNAIEMHSKHNDGKPVAAE